MRKLPLVLKYDTPAPYLDDGSWHQPLTGGWDSYSLPLGNGRFGANVFGRLESERIQISEPSLANPYYTPKTKARCGSCAAGVNSFGEIYLDINHSLASDYERTLDIDRAVAEVKYTYRGVRYQREIFMSNPDGVLVVRLTADKVGSISLGVRAEIPFIREYTVEAGDGLGKSGEVTAEGDVITLYGEMSYYGIRYFGRLKVVADGGTLSTLDYAKRILVKDADSVTLIFACDTNYELDESVFLCDEHEDKLKDKIPPESRVVQLVDGASEKSYAELYANHLADYTSLFSRVNVNLGANPDDAAKTTDELIREYRAGKRSRYLEALVFQYGRYLLISSSRDRLPAHLQGIWNAYADTAWSAGYWHNINIQMNYWPIGPTNLAETFLPYVNYAKAYRKKAEAYADAFVARNNPDRLSEIGDNGWIIGTGCSPYKIDGVERIGHSGPGTGAFTSLLFWDYYEYTGDVEFLREFGYPMLYGMSKFFSKVLVERDGAMLVGESASPENRDKGIHYKTVGCAFDQQMVYENDKRVLEAAEVLGIVNDPLLDEIRRRIDRLEPVLIGDDGQVKEYREERGYGSIGDPKHRHVSQLVGLYPGTSINENKPEWMSGARVTLRGRGDCPHGWSTAHRLLLWARLSESEEAMRQVNLMLENSIADNLWGVYPPFQIDGNFGYTVGVAEMLISSHNGYVVLLPALPSAWANGEFSGLMARGGFVVDCSWDCGKLTSASVTSKRGGTLRIKLPEGIKPKVSVGDTVSGIYTVDTKPGETIGFIQS